MENTNKPSETDSESKTSEGQENVGDNNSVGSSELVEGLSKITGREFKTMDEFQEHYKNLSSMVGDSTIAEQRAAAEEYAKLKHALTPDAIAGGFKDADEFIKYNLENSNANPVDTIKKTEDVASSNNTVEDWRKQREEKSQRETRDKQFEDLLAFKQSVELEKNMPEAAPYIGVIRDIAKARGETDLAKVVRETPELTSLVEANREKQATSVIETKGRVTPENSKEVDRAIKTLQDDPNNETARLSLAKVAMDNAGVK